MKQVYVKPFAVFEIGGKAFSMGLRTLYADLIAPEQYRWLSGIQGTYELEATPEQCEWLETLHLLSDKPVSRESEMARDSRTWGKVVEGLGARSIELMVAQACNMKCEYCYGTDGSYHSPGMMDEATAFAALDHLRREIDKDDKVQEVAVIFFGGEPLLNYDLIVSAVAYAEKLFADKKIGFGMTTNLTLMDDEKLDFFAAHPFHILVSFDGPRQYQARRVLNDGRESYDVMVELINKTIARLSQVAARATLYKDDDRDLVIEEFERLGFADYQLCGVSGNLGEGLVRDDLFFDDRERIDRLTKKSCRFVELLAERNEQGLRDLLHDREMKQLVRDAVRGLGVFSRRLIACGSGRSMFALSCEGEFYPCHRFVGQQEFCMGTLDTGVQLGDFADNILLCNPLCEHCLARYVCGGPCVHVCACDAEQQEGMPAIFNTAPTQCELMRTQVMLKKYLEHEIDSEAQAWLKQHDLLTLKKPD